MKQAAPLAGDGAGCVDIERAYGVAGRSLLVSVNRCIKRLANKAHGINFGFGSAADGQVGVAALDGAEGFTNREMLLASAQVIVLLGPHLSP